MGYGLSVSWLPSFGGLHIRKLLSEFYAFNCELFKYRIGINYLFVRFCKILSSK